MSLHDALGGMRAIPQWFVWKLVWDGVAGKYQKTPGAYHKLDASKSENWMSYADAVATVAALPQQPELRYALGFWMTAGCGYWFLDLDKAKGVPFAEQLVGALSGALVEWSSSGQGLHVIGRGPVPKHRSKPAKDIAQRLLPLQLEFYTSGRGIAFGLSGEATGSADVVLDMTQLVDAYFAPRVAGDASARGDWRGPEDDDVLIERMLAARVSAEAAFGGKASVSQLWRGEVERESGADMALASHLAFWTGCDMPRMLKLMWRSGLVRDKWSDHATYLSLTIGNAIDGCNAVYQERAPLPLPMQAATDDAIATASETSDLSNAARLKAAHGQNMLAVPGVGWHVWEGNGPWLQDDHAAYRLAFGIGRIVQAEADAMADWVNDQSINGSDEQKRRADIQKNRTRWAKASESRTIIYNCLDLAAKLPGMYAKADTLDASALLVGTPSGVIDLASCTQRAHDRADRITKRIACDYNPAAQAPTWQRFVHEVLGGDSALIDYVQTLCGYMLCGKRGEHLLPVFHGSGANGKSTFLSTLQWLLGDYAGTAAPGLLIARNGSEHPTGLAALQGLRLVVVSETGEAGRLNEEQVKQLTGGDRITARRMRQDFYEFDPTHIIALQTNHKPRVNGTDEGIWRRLKLIPFAVTIAPERRDPELPQKLMTEGPGILAWIVDGFRMYKLQGFIEPDAVRIATADYRSASDQIGQFIDDRCNTGPDQSIPSSGLYNAYKIWCAENGEYATTNKAFSVRLAERPGLSKSKGRSANVWNGLGIASYAATGHVLPLPPG